MKQILSVMLLLLQTAAFSQDLIVTNYAGPTTFSRYEEFAPDITVKNSGIVSINDTFFVAAYLSTDDQWQASDILVNSIYKYELGPGESYTGKPTQASVNAPPGTYYLIIKVDNSTIVTETDETNNLLIIPNVVINPPDVDFTLTTFLLDKSTYTQNSVVKPSYMLQNLGTTNTGGVVVIRFVLATNTTISQDDHSYIALKAEVLTGPDNFTSDEDLSITLPTVANGNYYILAWVDYQGHFEETNEANNVLAIPITIQSSNVDLVIINAPSSYSSGMLSSQITIRNNGTTGVAGYDVAIEVVPMGQTPSIGGVSSPIFDSYLGPNEEQVFFVQFSVYPPPPGTYYVAFTVNSQNMVQEAITWNNLYTDYSPVIYVPVPPTPGVTFNNLTVSGTVDDTDQQITLNVNLTNSGNTSSFNENYTVIVKNAQNTTVHSQQTNVWIDFNPGETVSNLVTLNLSSPLPVGTYQISVSCTSGCYTNPSSKSTSLTVIPTEYTLTGIVKGDDGEAITNGKLFLYEDDGSGNIKFIQKIVPYGGPSFSFPVDANPHTLYFIPDPIQYPNYVPTIYGKTLVLQESNFFTPSANMNVAFEILSVNPLGSGTGIINGRISSDNNPSGRLAQPLSVEPIADIPVILLSQSGQVVGITHTDESGFYQFANIPRGAYQVMPSFELDNLLLTEPFAVDITDKNMSVDLVVKADGIYPSAAQFLLPQLITFNAFSTYKYGDPSITPDAQSDIGLPIDYESSNESIAAVENGKIVIKGIGTVIITAKQPGNNFYLAASVNRSLTIIKADQHVTLSSFTAKTYGDDPFSIESSSSADLAVSLSSSDPSIAAVSGNTITIHGAGTVKITAVQPGNEFYNAAPPLQQLLTINKAAQAISFNDLPEQNVDADTFVLTGTASSGLDLTFESSDEEIVSIIGNIATVHKDGVVSITAHQPGNQNYLAADDVVRSQVVNVVLGIERVDLIKHVYPNPTRDFVFLQIPEVESVEVLDVIGRIRKDVVWIDGKIDFSRTESGVYFVKLLFQNRTEVTRVIKN